MLTKTFKFAMFALMLSPILMLAACDEHEIHEEAPVDPDTLFVTSVPAGGMSFGTFNQFEHDFATRDIDSYSDIDGFTFSLAQPSVVVITVSAAGGLDSWVDLYDAGFNFVSGDNDGGPGFDPVLVGDLPAGSYTIVIGGVGHSQGTYDMDIVVGSRGGLDFGTLTPNTLYFDNGGFIDNPSDADSYFFTLLNAQTVDLSMLWISGNFDGNLQLVDQFGQEVAFLDPVGLGDPEIFNLNLAAGTYMLVAAAGTGSGAYSIEVNVQ